MWSVSTLHIGYNRRLSTFGSSFDGGCRCLAAALMAAVTIACSPWLLTAGRQRMCGLASFLFDAIGCPLGTRGLLRRHLWRLGRRLALPLCSPAILSTSDTKAPKSGCSHAASVGEHLCTVLGIHKLWTVVRRLTCWPLQRRACWAHLHQFAVPALRRCRCMTNGVAALICCWVAHDVQCMTIASQTGYATY